MTRIFGDPDGAPPGISADPAAAPALGGGGASDRVAATRGNRRPEHPRTFLETNQALLGPVPNTTPGQKSSLAGSEKKASRRAPAASKGDAPAGELAASPEPAATPAARSLSSRPPHALVVSPVSLTPEEVQLSPGTRPKMPTLFGIGAPLEAALLPDTTEQVLLVADFALKLSLGPVSRRWLPEQRGCAQALLVSVRHRDAPELAATLAHLVALLADEVGPETAGDSLLQGALRDQLLDELSRLAGALPEWPHSLRDLKADARRRQARIARELFAKVDGLRRERCARMEDSPLEQLAAMSVEALAVDFDTPVERATELWTILDDYLRDRLARGPDAGEALGLALDALEQDCHSFDACDPERKDAQRLLRGARRHALAALNILLAERGELAWLDQLEPLSIGERVQRLRQWLGANRQRMSRE